MTRRAAVVMLGALVAYLGTGLATVGPGERGVVRRFGRVVARPGPGLWVGLPWGCDRLDRVQVGTARQVTVGADDPAGVTMLTGDQNVVAVRLVVEYAVGPTDADLDDYLAGREMIDALLVKQAEALAAEWAAGRGVDRVLLTGHAGLSAWVAGGLPGRLAPHRPGVAVQRVSVESLAAPAEVREAFDAVNQAQTAVRTQENQARQAAGRRSATAETVRFSQGQQAAAYRAGQMSLAEADAAVFLARLTSFRTAGGTPEALATIWWDEVGRLLVALKGRGRVDLLDHYLGPAGLDVTQFLTPRK